ncbi:MAG: hypothetical protein HUK15_07190, partial [Bacteroidales bacterium]|nr:hypothetical protein [Bacteroidales bacterium]
DNSYEIKYSSEADFPKLRYLDKETKLSAGYVETFDDENINIMEYFIEWDYAKSVAYRIGDTDAVIIFYSGKDLTEAFNNYMGYEDEK